MNGVAPGTLLVARYRLDEPLPSDLADVTAWSAHDQILDRPVRVSLVSGPHVADALDSARRAALVADPRLTRVLDVGSEQGVAYVVTEPYVGTTLTEVVAGGVLDPQQARAVVGEAAAALEAARRRGVHHLTVRPDALRVDDGRVVVTGLGLDAGVAGLDQQDPDRTSRADAVGLVALLYYALTARWAGPTLDVPWISDAAIHPLPAQPSGDGVLPPSAVRGDVPAELDTLCAASFATPTPDPAAWAAPAPGTPASPADVVAALEPWGEVSVVATLPGFVQPAAAGVNRQSVRSAFDSGAAAPPGTPPPAPPVRRPATGRIHRVGEVPGSAGAADTAPYLAAAAGGAYAGTTYAAEANDGPSTAPVPPPAHDTAPAGPAVPPSTPPPDDSWSEPAPRRGPRRFNATPFVLVLVLLLVGAGVVWAVNTAFEDFTPAVSSGERTSDEPSDTTPTGGETDGEAEEPEPEPEVRPLIASGEALDPQGDALGNNDGEHPEAVALAFDGQPETFWYTRRYNDSNFAGLRTGIGFGITLEQEAPVSTVIIDTGVEGGNVEIRSTSLDAPDQGTVLASGPFSPGVEFTFDEPVETETLVLWITELPTNAQGEARAEINEILLS
ncbi:protein kinase family protein [Cellulosimicrobium marinum]|uniref:protein kinase family protein n=1 Tax=Cellulosimicrobium marinum TaxID=1638992 RepID=UPI001E60DBC9|nr:protein kinase family protein [Cellulosimicrobium marinum]MCB7135778.1 protein kinase family protein [Cellulosimicrobium marinum]